MSEMDREKFWRLLELIPCAASGCLKEGRCISCNGNRRIIGTSVSHSWEEGSMRHHCDEILSIFQQLCQSSEVHGSGKHRVFAILAVRSFIMHTRADAYLDLGNSFLAVWCLKCLHSSLKELRIAAG